jgi:predicted esterase
VDRTVFAALAFVSLFPACKHADPVAIASDTTARQTTIAGTRVLEIFMHGATESSPLVIGLHGRGGSPDRFARVLADYPGPIELALPEGFLSVNHGSAWFDTAVDAPDGELARALDTAEVRLWPIIDTIAHGRRVIVTGFSQGAFMTFVLAARHPGAIAYAFPMSGGAPDALFPRNNVKTAPVFAFHGSADDTVPIAFDRATIEAFKADGAVAELREFPGTKHEMSEPIRAELMARISAVADTLAH